MPAEHKDSFTVSQAMNAAKTGLEKIRLSVIGEVSEFNDKPGYAAAYFTIRDDLCSMPCMMWRKQYEASGVELCVGMKVEVTGRFSCYPAKGRLQFSVSRVSHAGEGNLRLRVAQLARKLQAEGLMDPSRKRKVPALPKRIAVVTSPRGKAIHDVMRTLRRRYPLAELMIFGVPVEGDSAPSHLQDALHAACSCQPVPDVILLVRGGGSYEDLMPFNDEALARTVAASPIPIVTGIGHEPDNSLCDMVCDCRCSTPTAAAEAVAPSLEELQHKVNNATNALGNALSTYLAENRHALERLADRPLWHDEHYLTGPYMQSVDLMSGRLFRAIPDALAADAAKVTQLAATLRSLAPALLVSREAEVKSLSESLYRSVPTLFGAQSSKVALAANRLRNAGPHLVERQAANIALQAAKLDALSPLKTLSRGYSIAYAADGRSVVDSVQAVDLGDRVFVQVQDGSLACTVDSIERQ